MTRFAAISAVAILAQSICATSSIAANFSDCFEISAQMDVLSKQQHSIVSEYLYCLDSTGGQDISASYFNFVCDFEARRAQRGQVKLAEQAKRVQLVCRSSGSIVRSGLDSQPPLNILPDGFAAPVVANRALIYKGAIGLRQHDQTGKNGR
ncbi:MAG: hypothetical protein RL367_2269 [Pseudomonadota bacterium]|jgi:hypothetical protein